MEKIKKTNHIFLTDIKIKKPNRFSQVFLKCVWYAVLCTGYYLDLSLDIYVCFVYAKKSKWSYVLFSLTFICLPILFSLLVLIIHNQKSQTKFRLIKMNLLYK